MYTYTRRQIILDYVLRRSIKHTIYDLNMRQELNSLLWRIKNGTKNWINKDRSEQKYSVMAQAQFGWKWKLRSTPWQEYSHGALFRHICTFLCVGGSTTGSLFRHTCTIRKNNVYLLISVFYGLFSLKNYFFYTILTYYFYFCLQFITFRHF